MSDNGQNPQSAIHNPQVVNSHELPQVPTNSHQLDEMVLAKLDALRGVIASVPSALVAYSGGVDSALVMRVAHEVLGERMLACIGVSPSYPKREQRDALALAAALGIPVRQIYPNEISDANYAANPNNRCYFCKSALHDTLLALADAEGYAIIFDGTNADDVAKEGAFRPGIQAAREHGVRSPLLEAGLTKANVRAVAYHLGMPVWDKPAMACLSSRVPHGTAITPALLKQIEGAEDVLAALGFRQFRVRHHGDLARLELPLDDFPRLLMHREDIEAAIRAVGYTFVALDLGGFRSGSMNATRQPEVVGLESLTVMS